jgi:hypothetical protein
MAELARIGSESCPPSYLAMALGATTKSIHKALAELAANGFAWPIDPEQAPRLLESLGLELHTSLFHSIDLCRDEAPVTDHR